MLAICCNKANFTTLEEIKFWSFQKRQHQKGILCCEKKGKKTELKTAKG